MHAPTILDFLFHFLKEVLGIEVAERSRQDSRKREAEMLQVVSRGKEEGKVAGGVEE